MTDSVAKQVALHGTSLVEAGAGTGKTHTIVDDKEANGWQSREQRKGFEIKV